MFVAANKRLLARKVGIHGVKCVISALREAMGIFRRVYESFMMETPTCLA